MTESPQLVEARRLAQQLEKSRWKGGVRIVLQGSMRAIIKDGSADFESGWRADVFYGKARKPSFVMVAASAAGALRDVAALADESIPIEDAGREQETAAGRRWADAQSETEAADGDQVV